jgi:hypothetical protein
MTVNRRISTRRIVIIGTTVVAAAALSGGIAYAAQSPSGAPHGQEGGYGGYGAPGGQRGHAGPGGGGPRSGGPGGEGAGVLHGTEVRATNTAGTTTETDVFQTGTVTSVSATSLAVKSTDGFTAIYVLNSSTHEGNGKSTTVPAVGDKVSVRAVEKNGADTATEVHEAKTPTATGTPPASPSASTTG